MIKVDDFDSLVERAMRQQGRGHMRPVIAKELLHYDMKLLMSLRTHVPLSL